MSPDKEFEILVKESLENRLYKLYRNIARELGRILDKKNKEKEARKYILLSTKKRKYEIESQQDIDDLYGFGEISFSEKTQAEKMLRDMENNETYDPAIKKCKKEMEIVDRYRSWLRQEIIEAKGLDKL